MSWDSSECLLIMSFAKHRLTAATHGRQGGSSGGSIAGVQQQWTAIRMYGQGGWRMLRASCYVWEKFSGRVQMYDGCCSVKWRLKMVARKLRANCTQNCGDRKPTNGCTVRRFPLSAILDAPLDSNQCGARAPLLFLYTDGCINCRPHPRWQKSFHLRQVVQRVH